MNRSIKFRGRREDNGEWVYGYLIGTDVIVGDIVEFTDQYFNTKYWCMIDPETVGQFTGLKDRNGKEIYEGDIIQFEDMGEDEYYREGYDFTNRAIVTFEDGCFTLDEFLYTYGGVLQYIDNHEETWSVIKGSEVIGNRYNHSHLLKRDDTDE